MKLSSPFYRLRTEAHKRPKCPLIFSFNQRHTESDFLKYLELDSSLDVQSSIPQTVMAAVTVHNFCKSDSRASIEEVRK